jgi:outer membrane usher protein
MSAPSDLLFTGARPCRIAPPAARGLSAGADRDVFASTAILALTAAQGAAPASPPVPVAATAVPASSTRVRINPTKRILRFVVPLTDNGLYKGDVDLAVDPQDRLSVKAERLLQILEPILKPDVHARLVELIGSAEEADEAMLAREAISLSYDNENLSLAIGIPVAARRTGALSLGSGDQVAIETIRPEAVSGFLNLRSALDFVTRGPERGLAAPVAALDGAVRLFGIVAESEGVMSLRPGDPRFQRNGSRLVYDSRKHLFRATLGDVRPAARTFQSTTGVAGLAIARSYNVLAPGRESRATGEQSFTLQTPSTVETLVNGRTVERRSLQPGSYSLADFPLGEGANDVRLLITDQSGGQRTIEFNLYSNRQLLAQGATEFSAFAGRYSDSSTGGIRYSRDWSTQGFVRRGLSQQITAGANFQADAEAQQAGLEALIGSSLGLVGIDLAASRRSANAGGGTGIAAIVTFEKIIGSGGERQHSLRAFADYRSSRFAVPGALTPTEPQQLRASFGYALSLGNDRFLALDGQYGRERLQGGHRYGVRASGGMRLLRSLAAIAEVEWDRDTGAAGRRERSGPLARIGLRQRFGFRSSAQLDADTRGTLRTLYQTGGGQGIGTWSASTDLTRTAEAVAVNGTGSLTLNRAELAFNQLAAFDPESSRLSDIRSSLRFGTSLAFAGGSFAVGRPVQEAFLLALPHRSLKGAVRLDPQGEKAEAVSGALGPALSGSLSAYSPRMLLYDAPEAPPGYDLGSGNVQLLAPYKAGYRLEVGSDYHLMVIGRLLDSDGQPISLLAGKATDLAAPSRPGLTLFTSRNGRFGAQGLRPGRWRITMPTDGKPTIFELDVADDPSGTVRVGDLRPLEQGE